MSPVVFQSQNVMERLPPRQTWSCSFKSHRLEPRATDLANCGALCFNK